MADVTLVETMAHNGYLGSADVLRAGHDAYGVLSEWFAKNADRRVEVIMKDDTVHTGRLAAKHPFDVPGFVAVIADDCIILIACGIDSSWRTSGGINPAIASIEYEGHRGGSPS